MTNFCATGVLHKCPKYRFPPCECQRCSKLRSEGKLDQEVLKSCGNLAEYETNQSERKACEKSFKEFDASKALSNTSFSGLTCESKRFAKEKPANPCLTMPSFNFAPSNLKCALFDILGVTSFLIMISIMFWITVTQYLCYFVSLLLQSGRKTQLIAVLLLLLLCISITFHAIKGRHHHSHNVQPIKEPFERVQPPNCFHHKICRNRRCTFYHFKNSMRNESSSNEKNLSAKQVENSAAALPAQRPSDVNMANTKNSTLCILCNKHLSAETDSQPILSDKEVLEMYKRYKLYSYACEMRTPPSVGTILEIVSVFCNVISSSLARTFC